MTATSASFGREEFLETLLDQISSLETGASFQVPRLRDFLSAVHGAGLSMQLSPAAWLGPMPESTWSLASTVFEEALQNE